MLTLGIHMEPVPTGAPFPIWLVHTGTGLSHAALALLSAEECARADRFRSERLRSRYIGAHAARSALIEAIFGVSFDRQSYQLNEFGKPQLTACSKMQHSISYTGQIAALGLSLGNAIGIDVECNRAIADAADIAALHYSCREMRSIDRVIRLGMDGAGAFLRVWVRKEACLKATGCGLSGSLSDLECGIGSKEKTVRSGERRIRTGISQYGDCHISHSLRDLIIGWAHLL